MSTLIGLRFGDTAVLATDSRTTDNSGQYVLSDSAEKILEVAPAVYYGWSGYGALAYPQAEIAREFAKTANMGNLRAFADSLDSLSMAAMGQLLATLKSIRCLNPKKYEGELLGNAPFHAYVLAGLSDGQAGFLAREFYLVDGKIVHREIDGFCLPPGNDFMMYSTFGEVLADIIPKTETWAAGAVRAAERFVDVIRRTQPLVGGPTQLVCLDKAGGARWVHRPIAQPKPLTAQLAIGTLNAGVVYSGQINTAQLNAGVINAAITMTSVALHVTSGALTFQIDATNLFKITNSSSGAFAQLSDVALVMKNTTTSDEVDVTSSAILLQAPGNLAILSSTGFGNIGGSTGFTGTLAAAIAAGKSVVGGIIVN